jgi:hypothetical protein
MSDNPSPTSTKLTKPNFLLKLFLVPVGIILLLHGVLRILRDQFEFIMHQFWPLSIFMPVVPGLSGVTSISQTFFSLLVAGTIFGLIILVLRSEVKGKILWLLALIYSLTVTTNLIAGGWQYGIVFPTANHGDEDYNYWQDTLVIKDVGEFLQNYTILQPTLGYHTRVHPPLAVLIYYYLRQGLNSPGLASLMIGGFGLVFPISVYWLIKELTKGDRTRIKPEYYLVLAGILPAFQIYAIAALDPIIAGIFGLSLAGFIRIINSSKSSLMTYLSQGIWFLLSSLLTFGFVWLWPIMFSLEFIMKGNVKKFSLVFGGWMLATLLVFGLTGYDYFTSFGWLGLLKGRTYFLLLRPNCLVLG